MSTPWTGEGRKVWLMVSLNSRAEKYLMPIPKGSENNWIKASSCEHLRRPALWVAGPTLLLISVFHSPKDPGWDDKLYSHLNYYPSSHSSPILDAFWCLDCQHPLPLRKVSLTSPIHDFLAQVSKACVLFAIITKTWVVLPWNGIVQK